MHMQNMYLNIYIYDQNLLIKFKHTVNIYIYICDQHLLISKHTIQYPDPLTDGRVQVCGSPRFHSVGRLGNIFGVRGL